MCVDKQNNVYLRQLVFWVFPRGVLILESWDINEGVGVSIFWSRFPFPTPNFFN